ncbi:serine/threonine-protein kinase [Planotetraspora phitsanulokensis]|nr:serine/threonine-protein kinase [Planotetraspora phitsanulokensis]
MSVDGPRLPHAEVQACLGSQATFLGGGTFGDTWRCGSEAVKVLCGAASDPSQIQREINGLTRVKHPNVVELYEVRMLSIGGDSYPAMIFEYIAGGDVLERLLQDQWPSTDEAEDFLRNLLEGINALHETSTIHRDIKPANIALRNGRWNDPVILDLGLSKQLDARTITVYPNLIGTPLYMAPEQLRGERAVKASDLWAVGLVTAQLLLREHPFYKTGENISAQEYLDRLRIGPPSFPPNLKQSTSAALKRLLSYVAYSRGSARSNLRRLSEGR